MNKLKDLQNAIKELQQLKDDNVIPLFADGMLKAYYDLFPLVENLTTYVLNEFTKEQMEESFNDGIACQKQRAGYFDIDNYK